MKYDIKEASTPARKYSNMGYSNKLAVSLLLFVAFAIPRAEAEDEIDLPWSNPETLKNFMGDFMENMQNSAVFSENQLSAMYGITDTMKISIGSTSSKSKLQAMNKSYFASITEIAKSDEGGVSMAQKTDAIVNSLKKAYLSTTGEVDENFLNDVKQMMDTRSGQS